MPSHATAQHNSEIRRRQLDGEDISAADHSSLHAIPPIDNPASPAEFPATREHFAPPVEGHYRLKDGRWNDEVDDIPGAEARYDDGGEISPAMTTAVYPHEGQPDAKGPLPGEDSVAADAPGVEDESDVPVAEESDPWDREYDSAVPVAEEETDVPATEAEEEEESGAQA